MYVPIFLKPIIKRKLTTGFLLNLHLKNSCKSGCWREGSLFTKFLYNREGSPFTKFLYNLHFPFGNGDSHFFTGGTSKEETNFLQLLLFLMQ